MSALFHLTTVRSNLSYRCYQPLSMVPKSSSLSGKSATYIKGWPRFPVGVLVLFHSVVLWVTMWVASFPHTR